MLRRVSAPIPPATHSPDAGRVIVASDACGSYCTTMV